MQSILKNFFVFESIDGAGTTTQLNCISNDLTSRNLNHRITYEPTSGSVGKLIRKIINKTEPSVQNETIARLFAADRWEHLYGTDGIVSSCNEGTIVISDRYFFSSLAYQGVQCGIDFPYSLNKDFPLPEILFFFSIDATISMDRIKKREVLDSYENLSFQKKVEHMYTMVLDLYKNTNMKIVILDATQPKEVITSQIKTEIDLLY